jgi:peptide/nickel transport system permease protein
MGRVAEAIATLFFLVTLTFLLAHAVPDGPAYAILGLKISPERLNALNTQFGLDAPLWRQYATWLWHLLHGNLGFSYLQTRPVAAVIGAYAGRTVVLYTVATALAAVAAIGFGWLHGVFYRSWPGRVCSGIELFLYAMPGFFIATVLGMVFGSWLHVLPACGMADLHQAAPGLADRMAHMVLPASSMALFVTPWLARIFAQGVHEEFSRDYVRTARARGVGFGSILLRHVTPNAIRPMVTMLGLSLPAIFSGNVVVESVFDYPGIGWLLWRSAVAHDYPVLVGIVLVLGVATMLGNLAADLVNAWLDPRVTYAE